VVRPVVAEADDCKEREKHCFGGQRIKKTVQKA